MEILVNLVVNVSVIGGLIMAVLSILILEKSLFFVMEVGATALGSIFLNRTCKNYLTSLKIEIRIAHFPPYTSKYNPIEHRLFPHITRSCKGVIFKTIDLVNNLMEQTTTTKGLTVVSRILCKTFEVGRKVAEGFKENMRIKFDEFLPLWNYVAIPKSNQKWDII